MLGLRQEEYNESEDTELYTRGPEPNLFSLTPPKRDTRGEAGYKDLITYDDVLLIRNLNSPMSMQIADYFIAKRNISNLNICNISAPTTETVNRGTFDSDIRSPIETYITMNNLLGDINYFITTKGVPLRISEDVNTWDRACVDSDLALIMGPYQGSIGNIGWLENPYFNVTPYPEFSWNTYGFFLVTRFTGYDFEDIKALIDTPEIAIGRHGTFVMDVDPGKDGDPGYKVGNDWMRRANTTLTQNGFSVFHDETSTFHTNNVNVSGYTSWGSNDGNYPSNTLPNPGFENDGDGDGVPDDWYFVNEPVVGYCELNDTEVRSGTWSVRITRNSTSDGLTYTAQNYTLKPDTRYYMAGFANLSGVSAEKGVHLQVRAYDSLGDIVMYYNGSTRTGTTTSWVSLGQVHFEPIDGITNISICAVLSKSSGTVYFDDLRIYEIKPQNQWIPGALAETYVSTGGRSFNYPTQYGQSLVADLIRDGVSGVKGYVYEPFLSACAHPDIIFDAYTQGFNLAESYYLASQFLSWMDVVVGDPKLAPYDLDIVPDLSILKENITFSEMPQSGTVVKIFARVSNLGPWSAKNVEVRFYEGDPFAGGTYIGNRTMDVEGLGENVTYISWDTTGYLGYYNITVIVDAADLYYESNEGNNIANNTMAVHDGFPDTDAGSDSPVNEDSLHVFDGFGTTSNSSIVNYTWYFGDGEIGYGPSPSHSYELSGVYDVILNVTNSWGVWGTDLVKITVNNVDPTADAGSNLFGTEMGSIEFNASGSTDTPSDVDSLNYTWYFGDGGSQYGKIVYHAYADDGIYTATLEVRDDDGDLGDDNISVTVNNRDPVIESVSPQNVDEDTPFTLQINATDVPEDTITFSDNVTFFEIDPATGFISFTPVNDDVGAYMVNITASDEDGGEAWMEFYISISNTNDPPGIVSTPPANAVEEEYCYYDVVVDDDDLLVSPSETIYYSLDSAPPDMSINSKGNISWRPYYFQASQTFEVIVNVTDGEEYDIQVFEIFVINVNDAPQIVSAAETSAVEDTSYTYQVNATDVDPNDTLSYHLDEAPQGMTIDGATGLISWLPTNEHVGSHTVIVNVTDLEGAFDIQEFEIHVDNQNDAPILEPIGDLTAVEDEPFEIDINASDEDLSDSIDFSDDSSLFEIDRESGIISFTPTNDQVGTYTVKITVEDKTGASDSETITFTVHNQNDPPEMAEIDDVTVKEDSPFILSVTCLDIDEGDSITFSDDTGLFDIDPQTGEIYFVPTNDDVGEYTVNISVVDENGGIDFQIVLFRIENENDPPVLDEESDPRISEGFSIPAGEPFSFTFNAADEDSGDSLTYTDNTPLFDIDPNSGEIIFTPKKEDAGVHVVKITVTDEEGRKDHTIVTFEIEGEEEGEDILLPFLIVVIIVVVCIIVLLFIRRRGGQEEKQAESPQEVPEMVAPPSHLQTPIQQAPPQYTLTEIPPPPPPPPPSPPSP